MGNGYEDFYGLFASSNIKFGFNYVPIDNLLVGVSLAKSYMNSSRVCKICVMQQTKGEYPVSISYYTDVAWIRGRDNYTYPAHEFMFFNQLMIARKITEKLSCRYRPVLLI
jgi:hypothetical protein